MKSEASSYIPNSIGPITLISLNQDYVLTRIHAEKEEN